MKKHGVVMVGGFGLSLLGQPVLAVEQGDCNGSGGMTPVTIQDVICTINIVLGTAVPPLPAAPRPPKPTGITFGGNYPSGNNADCTGVEITAQDCAHAPGGQAGFDFTKLAATGDALALQGFVWDATVAGAETVGTRWSCVQDNQTGLIWEVKTAANKDDTFRWGGLTAIGRDAPTQFGVYDDGWNALVTSSNSGSGLCGFTDWRVPTLQELSSLVHYGEAGYTIDSHYFPHAVAHLYWSASPYAVDSSSAWQLVFGNGGDGADFRDNSKRVRLVRTGP